jgi:hypothetical protein
MFEWGVLTVVCNLGYGRQDGAMSAFVLWDLALRPQKLGKCRGTFEFSKSGSHSLKNRKLSPKMYTSTLQLVTATQF